MIADQPRHTAIGQNGFTTVSNESKSLGKGGGDGGEETGQGNNGELHCDNVVVD